jgi:hypothetical protein
MSIVGKKIAKAIETQGYSREILQMVDDLLSKKVLMIRSGRAESKTPGDLRKGGMEPRWGDHSVAVTAMALTITKELCFPVKSGDGMVNALYFYHAYQ